MSRRSNKRRKRRYGGHKQQAESKAAEAQAQAELEGLIASQAQALPSTYWKRDRPRSAHGELCSAENLNGEKCKRLVQEGGRFCSIHV